MTVPPSSSMASIDLVMPRSFPAFYFVFYFELCSHFITIVIKWEYMVGVDSFILNRYFRHHFILNKFMLLWQG